MNTRSHAGHWIGLSFGLLLCLGFLYGCLMHNPPGLSSVPHFDKIEHAGAFVAMAGWFGALYPRRMVRLFVLLAIYAAVTELLQWWSGYRDGDPFDWLADVAGIVVGFALAGTLVTRRLSDGRPDER